MIEPIRWQLATVRGVRPETSRVKTLTLALPDWTRHLAGQHYDVRLTAPDGYQAERSYSVASEPEREGEIDLTVERLEEGEVSTYLADVLIPGDKLEVRGPIGGYFVWEAAMGGPLLLVAGGSGVVPLMAMLRHRRAVGSRVPARLLYSVRSPEEAIYHEELARMAADDPALEVIYTLTRVQPPGWEGYRRRIDREILGEVLTSFGLTSFGNGAGGNEVGNGVSKGVLAYVCGPTSLVESAANGLVELGLPPTRVRTERFGPTGVPT